jgi:alkylhydroperoxidase family enzyme
VSDELTDGLLKYLSMAELVELTSMIAVENLRSRVNSAFGLKGQGFSDQCQIRSVS